MKDTRLINLIKGWPFEDKEKELRLKLIEYLPSKFLSYIKLLLLERQKNLVKLEKGAIGGMKKLLNS